MTTTARLPLPPDDPGLHGAGRTGVGDAYAAKPRPIKARLSARAVTNAARSLSRRAPLRVKLTAAMLALVAVALTVFGIGSVSVLSDYLVARVDRQLAVVSSDVERRLERAIIRPVQLRIPPEALVRIRDPDGVIVSRLAGSAVEDLTWPVAFPDRPYVVETVGSIGGDGRWRVRTARIDGIGTVETAVTLSSVDQIIVRLVAIELLVGGIVLAVLAGIGVLIVRRSLRPLREIEHTAGAIAAGRLGLRVPDHDSRTEVGSLARSLNTMLTQIETAFRDRAESEAAARRSEDRMRRFIADASHELRTPLTSIRGFAEFFRQNPEADPVRLMARVEAQASRMGLLVDDLLLLARLDQQRPLQTQPVDLLALAADAVNDAQVLAPDRDISLSIEGDAALIVTGDEVRLRQVIGNLTGNALAHTPPGTPVTVRVGTRPRDRHAPPGAPADAAFIEVCDKGPGLTAEQAERVFERFYRADPARARRTSDAPAPSGGSGLGLSIVAALVTAHGGTVSVETAPGAGATFRVILPLAPEARDTGPLPASGPDTP
ncbi:HAMP domain-containing sensor histidine kinase [Thermopolyspora sp. NPDC052614]|uniref:sensor histidine kinase n=1 Tax=Thermopolyspora sp. NPDC052614 TaxID=3155682 RepID=UPI003416344C